MCPLAFCPFLLSKIPDAVPTDASSFYDHEMVILFTKDGREGAGKESAAPVVLEKLHQPSATYVQASCYMRKINPQFRSSLPH